MQSRNTKGLIVAGGGTGGHVFAGVAVADAWRQKFGAEASVLFVGAQGKIEEKLVPRAGYRLSLLGLGSLNRVGMGTRLQTLSRMPLAFLRSIQILWKEKPMAVLGVGGYASGPLVLTARLLSFFKILSLKTAILEQNSIPGMTNRWLGRWVHGVFCSFPGTEKAFPRTRWNSGLKVQVTGNPVRTTLQPLPPPSQVKSGVFTVFVFGGSQGAKGLNTLVMGALPLLSDLGDRVAWIHQTGELDYERVREAHLQFKTQSRVEKFIYEMGDAYQKSSVLICRAGSSTLSEIAAVGRPAVLVPLPTAADNHQEANARVFSDREAAFLLLQKDGAEVELARWIRQWVDHPQELDSVAKRVQSFHQPQAAAKVVELLTQAWLQK